MVFEAELLLLTVRAHQQCSPECFCPSDLLETGHREGVVAAVAGVVEEDGAWAEETASTPVGNENSTNTAALTKRESLLNRDVSRPVNPHRNNKYVLLLPRQLSFLSSAGRGRLIRTKKSPSEVFLISPPQLIYMNLL